VWVDDEFFHIDYHVRHIALPHPGTEEQLKELAGRLMSQQLDRSKPLWELNIVEGLESGGFAIITKIHHCMIDGMSGIDLMAVILDFTDKLEHVEPAPWVARPAPNGTELAVREIARSVSSLLASFTHLSDLRGGMSDRVDSLKHRAEASLASLGSGWLTPTGKTPLNGPIGPGRSFEWLELPLDGVKKIKDTHGATVNDAMLAIVAGGIRHYLLTEAGMTAAELAETDFRIMAPVSVRTKSERGTMGNKVAMWLITLPLAEPDPAKRIAKIKRATKELKETDQRSRQTNRQDQAGDEGVERDRSGARRIDAGLGVDGCPGDTCLTCSTTCIPRPTLQHDRDERSRATVSAVHGRIPDAGHLSARATVAESRIGDRDVLPQRGHRHRPQCRQEPCGRSHACR
jgi:WS/DGAT/MGAT family acyltransferase